MQTTSLRSQGYESVHSAGLWSGRGGTSWICNKAVFCPVTPQMNIAWRHLTLCYLEPFTEPAMCSIDTLINAGMHRNAIYFYHYQISDNNILGYDDQFNIE